MPNTKRLKFFDKDFIEWNDKEPLLQNFYQRLLNLKTTNSALHKTGNIEMLPTDYNDNIFAFTRMNGNNKVVVILNLSNRDQLQFKLSHPLLEDSFTNLFSDFQYKLGTDQSFEMQSWESIVLYK